MQFILTVLETRKPKDFFLFDENRREHYSNKFAQFLLDNEIGTS
jgi:hypothetical protein